ncbi:MAG TPA: hypothetical protein PKD53_18445, partial [Chloroflexaceae bacterium]|nr:hypothetical protein [Chloroflexaceae bacterium]
MTTPHGQARAEAARRATAEPDMQLLLSERPPTGTTTPTATAATMPVREHLYDLRLQLTEFVEYGVSLADLNSGRAAPPPEGTRIDLGFEGVLEGAKLSGSIRGRDYLAVRADGRF